MNSFQIADILHFAKYHFTDTGESTNHFAFVLLPSTLTQYVNQIYCAVVSSKPDRKPYFSLILNNSDYSFFSCDSYVHFLRQDLQSMSDLSKDKQPLSNITDTDYKKAFKILKKIIFNPEISSKVVDKYFAGTILREWKKRITIVNK